MLVPILLATLAAPSTPFTDLHQRIERAVLTTQLDKLNAIRRRLSTDLAGSMPGATRSDLRYLLAYVDWRASQLIRSDDAKSDARDTLLEEAQETLEALVEDRPTDGEAHALLASVLGARIGDSFFRGLRLGPRSSSLFDKALELAPNSPRVALLRGIRSIFTPSMFGGGLEVAQAELDRAQMLFDKEKGAAWPSWGRMDVFAWRGQLAAKRGNRAGARALYERALDENPDARWIRDQLLPALERPASDE